MPTPAAARYQAFPPLSMATERRLVGVKMGLLLLVVTQAEPEPLGKG